MYDNVKQSLPILTGRLCIFAGKDLLRYFALFKIRPFAILPLGSRDSQVSWVHVPVRFVFPHIFSQSGTWLFTFLTIPQCHLTQKFGERIVVVGTILTL